MMSSIEKEIIKKKIPVGTKVRLIKMDDEHPVPPGTTGIVNHIDDMGQIHVAWENHSTLALIYDKDKFEIIKEVSK